jgi:hypothetical protein
VKHFPFRSWSPFLLAMLLYGLFLGFALIRIWPLTNGDQIYLLDDTYIHLAIAKNLLLHGNYGISAVEPAMASSSILWPYLLAFGGKIFGLSVLLPLLLNVIFSLALLAIALKVMRGSDVTSLGWQTVTLVLVVIGFPLTTMTLDGMEHVLFGLVFILFVWRAGLVMGGERLNEPLKESGIIFLALFLTSCRYEGIFAVFVVCLMLLRRKPLLSLATGLAGLAPVLIFGMFSRHHGGMWVPNSLVMKTLDHSSFGERFLTILREMGQIYIWKCGLAGLIFLLTWMILRRSDAMTRTQRSMLSIFVWTALLHVEFARLRAWTSRYESYLIGLGILLACIGFAKVWDLKRQSLRSFPVDLKVLGILAILPLVVFRGVWLETMTANAAAGIYRQQYQVAKFLSRYYRGQPVVANDIGAISFYADVQCFDLWGLGNNEVAYQISRGAFTASVMERMANERGVRIGFLYPDSFRSLPKQWIPVASWTMPPLRGATVGGSKIYFYALHAEDRSPLINSLQAYKSSLPPMVEMRILVE